MSKPEEPLHSACTRGLWYTLDMSMSSSDVQGLVKPQLNKYFKTLSLVARSWLRWWQRNCICYVSFTVSVSMYLHRFFAQI